MLLQANHQLLRKRPVTLRIFNVDVSFQLDNITQLINCRSGTIEQNISDVNKKVDAVTSELKSVAVKVMSLERSVDQVEQPISQMQRRMDDLETYMRRRNPKLIGILEVAEENICPEVIRICQALLPSEKEKLPEVVDVVLPLGKPQQGSGGGRPRATIIQFSTRTFKRCHLEGSQKFFFSVQQRSAV